MALTPRLFAALRKRRSVEHERQEFLLALLNRNIVSFSMCRPKDYEPTIRDFMPSQWGKEEPFDEAAMARQQMALMSPELIAKGLVIVAPKE